MQAFYEPQNVLFYIECEIQVKYDVRRHDILHKGTRHNNIHPNISSWFTFYDFTPTIFISALKMDAVTPDLSNMVTRTIQIGLCCGIGILTAINVPLQNEQFDSNNLIELKKTEPLLLPGMSYL